MFCEDSTQFCFWELNSIYVRVFMGNILIFAEDKVFHVTRSDAGHLTFHLTKILEIFPRIQIEIIRIKFTATEAAELFAKTCG